MDSMEPIEIRPVANGFFVLRGTRAPHCELSREDEYVFVDYASLFKFIEGLYGPIANPLKQVNS